MFGRDGWRPLTVAVLVSGAVFLPQGVAIAAPPDGACTSADCQKRGGDDHSFVGPVVPHASQRAASTSSGSSVAGTSVSGSATAGTAADAAATSGTTTVAPAAPAAAPPAPVAAPAPAAGAATDPGNAAASRGAAAAGTASGGTASAGTAAGGTAPADGTATQPSASPPVVTQPSNDPSAIDPSATNPWDWSTTGAPTSSSTRPESGSSADGSGSGSTGSGSSNSGSGSSNSGSSNSGSSSSGSGSSGSSDSSGSSSSGSGSSGSSSGSVSGGTTSGVDLGAASCPTGVGSGTSTEIPSAATGSVTIGAPLPQTNTSGVASVTDVTGAHVGTADAATSQAVASQSVAGTSGGTAAVGGTSSVAGTVIGAAASAAGRANMPGELIDLSSWYLTLPTGQQGSPDTIQNPSLERFTNEFFKINPSRDGVQFSARGDGVTTKNSHYPRSELREMNGGAKASWSNTSGSHTLDVCEAITKVPNAKPEVVAAQIHDDKDDVLQIRLEGQTLIVLYDNGKSRAVLDPAYKLGTPYNTRIIAANSSVDVYYNGQKKAELPLSGSGWYWKVGAYVQSNTSKGDATAEGEVTVYSLKCVHSA
jgi:poly(beta-D-mannuronate) lyase